MPVNAVPDLYQERSLNALDICTYNMRAYVPHYFLIHINSFLVSYQCAACIRRITLL